MSRGDEGLEPDQDPLWYKDAVIYELPVRAFRDGGGNGMGDFAGLTEKLDYLQDLGITAVWLLPFYPSPLKDDGYDIADYTDIHPNYGTLHDFEVFLQEAHRRGLRVITELVVNHTSDQHAWFQRARRAPAGSPLRDFYVWSDTPEKYKEARIIFKDFETSNWAWDNVAKAYYWHRFYSHQPDLNYDNPQVWKALFPVVDFWLAKGVDGMRLDAVPYLFEREGTNCENLPETHGVLKALRQHVEAKYPNRMFLAEANQWPEDAIAYFGAGDECQTAFHFPLMPRMFMAISTEDRFPVVDILAQTPPIPDNCKWVLFLRNHDELTLEMVTDEERDYMYRAYAKDPQARINLGIRRRLAPLLSNNRRRIELMNALLFSLPGTPVIYYGDEIGMGDNIYLGDRNGVRTPMQWSSDRNAGFSRANSQKLYLPVIIDPEYHYEAVNVEAQQNNPHSLLWWMKRLIALRKRYKALGRGTLEFLFPENPKILAFVRRYGDELILVVANLSRFMQHFELNLAEFEGRVPVELFGRVEFPTVGKDRYFLMLGPHGFCWFALEPRHAAAHVAAPPASEVPALKVRGGWEHVLQGRAREALERVLPAYLHHRRWFGGKARQIRQVQIQDDIPVEFDAARVHLLLLRVEYLDSDPDTYVLPLAFAAGEQAQPLLERTGQAVVAQLHGEADGYLYDALWQPSFCSALLELMAGNRRLRGWGGELLAGATDGFTELRQQSDAPLEPALSKAEQSNTSVAFGERMMLKLFRRLEEGLNPDLEITRFLTQKCHFPHVPPMIGALEYRVGRGQPATLAVLQGFVHNEGTGWKFTLDALGSFFERAAAKQTELRHTPLAPQPLLDLAAAEMPPLASEVIGPYLEAARLLGQRTAELHIALASDLEDPAFAPEGFTTLYQRSVYQSMRSLAGKVLRTLNRQVHALDEPARSEAQALIERWPDLVKRFRSVIEHRIRSVRIRCHGDYHLGQVLWTGKDFVLIDFEGEPVHPLSERRLKRSPLRDVAGMVRSFDYAANSALIGHAPGRNGSSGVIRPEDVAVLEPWSRFWYAWVSAAFLKSYLDVAGPAGLLPASRDELKVLLDAFLLEKAVYEVDYELHHRPDWLCVPVQGIMQLLKTPG
jgi:maltose alpha-D-glucosyltransferase/alpha-amylase